MKIKEQIVRQSIEKITLRLTEINELLSATPVSEIIKIRQEAAKLLDENKGGKARTSNEFIEKIKELSDREKEQFDIAKKASNSSDLINEKVELEMQLYDLKNELFFIERNK